MTSAAPRFRRLAVVTAVSTLVLTSLGGLVRATESGLGCADEWPTCLGGWIAPLEYHAMIEWTHRAVAGVVALLIFAMVFASRRWAREHTSWFRLSLLAAGLVVFQAWLGQLVVTSELHGAYVTAHFTAALALVALTSVIATSTLVVGRSPAGQEQRRFRRMAMGAVWALLPLLLVGALVRERGAGLVFSDWPLMGGSLIPSLEGAGRPLHLAHRLLALLVALHLVGLFMRGRRDERWAVRTLALGGTALYMTQVLVGASNVWTRLHPAAVMAHASLSFITWAAFVSLAVVAGRADASRLVGGRSVRASARAAPPPAPPSGPLAKAVAYVRLTKPRIITLLLITTVPAMVMAQRGMPPLWLIGATLLGGTLTAGSANALNQYLERDIDVKMRRTSSRPLPARSVPPTGALVFALLIGAAGVTWLWLVVNPLSAALAFAAIAFYVGVYTVLLKRSTPQNIVIGGAAGAAPVLIGWAAVTGTVEAPAWIMFAIVFLWTPPHFWALAMRYRDDYASAGVPMLPVVKGDAATTLQILLYAVVLVGVTLLLSPVGGLGVVYAVAAAGLGGWFVYRAVRLRLDPGAEAAMRMFRYSVAYLGLLFGAIAVDRLLW